MPGVSQTSSVTMQAIAYKQLVVVTFDIEAEKMQAKSRRGWVGIDNPTTVGGVRVIYVRYIGRCFLGDEDGVFSTYLFVCTTRR